MNQIHSCPSCGASRMEVFYEVERVPANSCILMASPEEATAYPRGDIRLGFCPECGFVSNTAFEPRLTEYSGRYEETQGFSGTFNSFHRGLAERLIGRYGLRSKEVLEIGCGKGEFLALLSELGNNRGIGFDPGYREDRNLRIRDGQVTFIKDFYSEEYADHKADFVCCKMTLEHIQETDNFVGTVRRAIGERSDTVVFFQIPEALRILRECAFEDIYYEHCSYFSPGSLARLFRRNGFHVLALETEYADQYLTIEAKPGEDGGEPPLLSREDDLGTLRDLVATFPARCTAKIEGWRERFRDWKASGLRTVLWGSGSKGVSFLTSVDTERQVEYVVDINPYRQGYFMPGTGQRIVAPSFLNEYRPDIVIVMNGIYLDEISRDLAELGLSPRVLAL